MSIPDGVILATMVEPQDAKVGPIFTTNVRLPGLHKEMFFVEIAEQCRIAELAFTDLVKRLVAPPVGPDVTDAETTAFTRSVWRSTQEFLVACGLTSRILYPSNNAPAVSRERGEHLRHLLGLTEESPLRDRFVRDDLEHIDERMDRWLPTLPAGTYAVTFSTGNVIESEPEPKTTLRLLNTKTLELTILGEPCSLLDLAAAMADLDRRLPTDLADFVVEGKPSPPSPRKSGSE